MGVEMSNETCPHCGARRTVTADKKRRHFECDTIYFRANSYERGYDCYERQIERLMQLFTDPENQPTQYGTVTLEYMEREIAKEREACAKVCESHVCTSDCSAYGLGSNCEFVISAEIRARGEMK